MPLDMIQSGDTWATIRAKINAIAVAADVASGISMEAFGAVGDGVTDDAAALLAASQSGFPVVNGTFGKTYLIDSPITTLNASRTLIDLTGCEVIQGPNANPGWEFVGCTDVMIIGGRSGQWTGNRDSAGPWDNLLTTTAFTNGTGTAAAAYAAGVSTVTINGLTGTHLTRGARFEHIVSGITYGYIVQNDVAISGGTATGVQLDRGLVAPIASGQQVYVKAWGRRLYVGAAVMAGTNVIKLRCAGVTSLAGTPMIRAGDQFYLHTNYNDIRSVDTSVVFTAASDAAFTGTAPALEATVTLTSLVPANIALGTMTTSIQDYRNNKHVPVLFWNCTRCGVIGMRLRKARLHGFTANANITAPWRSGSPAANQNRDMIFADNYDESSTGVGAAFLGAWVDGLTMVGNTGEYTLGSLRSLQLAERSTRIKALDFSMTGGQYGMTINGECRDVLISRFDIEDAWRAIRQANTCRQVRISDFTIITNATYSDYGILVLAGTQGEDGEPTGAGGRVNDTTISGGTITGPTRTAGGRGSHVMVEPQGGDAPYRVKIHDFTSIGATLRGIDVQSGDACKVSDCVVAGSGLEGVRGLNCVNSIFDSLTVAGTGTVTPGAGLVLDGGTGYRVYDNAFEIGGGLTSAVGILNGAQIVDMRTNGPASTITPAFGGAKHDGSDDLAAYNAAFAAAPADFTLQISKPSVLSAAITQGGKEPLFEQTGPVAWASSNDASRAFPGIADATLPAKYAKVLHKRTNRTDGGGTLFVSMRALATASVADYEKDGLLSIAISSDPSAGAANGGTGANINRDVVGVGARGYVQVGNTAARVWGLNAYVYVPSGAEGIAQAVEVNVDHAASVVTDFSLPFQKNGANFTTKNLAGTFGAVVNKGTGDGWTYGFAVDSNALDATVGKSAFEYRTFWRVSKAGNMYVGKPSGADTETGIALMQANGAVTITRNGNIGTTKFIRGDTLAAAATLWNQDTLGYSAAGNQRTLARIQTALTIATDGAEDAEIRFQPIQAGALANQLRVGSGVAVGASAILPGVGNLNVQGFAKVGSYTVATVPSASASGAGAIIYVSNESGGATPAFSDGTNWRRFADRAIIS